MRPIETMKLSIEIKTRAPRTGKCQMNESATALPKTTTFSISDTATAERHAEASQVAGGHGLVKTIFKLRLRTCDEIMNRPTAAARNSKTSLRPEKIPCNALKSFTPEPMKRAGSELKPVNKRKTRPKDSSKRLRR